MPSIYTASHFYGFSCIENGWETSAISGHCVPTGHSMLNVEFNDNSSSGAYNTFHNGEFFYEQAESSRIRPTMKQGMYSPPEIHS